MGLVLEAFVRLFEICRRLPIPPMSEPFFLTQFQLLSDLVTQLNSDTLEYRAALVEAGSDTEAQAMSKQSSFLQDHVLRIFHEFDIEDRRRTLGDRTGEPTACPDALSSNLPDPSECSWYNYDTLTALVLTNEHELDTSLGDMDSYALFNYEEERTLTPSADSLACSTQPSSISPLEI